MKRDTSYDADIMQFGSVLPFETSLGGERNKGGMPTIVATEAQLDVMFSGSDPGSVGLDAARAMSIGGSQGDWTHTGTSGHRCAVLAFPEECRVKRSEGRRHHDAVHWGWSRACNEPAKHVR